MDLSGKQAIVTGGVRGLGRAVVDSLLAKGAEVTVFDLDTEGLSQLASEHPGVRTNLCDVSDDASIATALDSFHARTKAAHILVNNAGILRSTPLLRMAPGGLDLHPLDEWNKVLASNLTSVFLMTRRVTERMVLSRTRGVVVNISSISARGNPGQSAYSAAKAGVEALTAVWAKELGPWGIRVAAIAPGFVGTDSTRTALSESVLKETIAKVPLRRLGEASEIAKAVMAAIDNDFMNGKVLSVDGGLVL